MRRRSGVGVFRLAMVGTLSLTVFTTPGLSQEAGKSTSRPTEASVALPAAAPGRTESETRSNASELSVESVRRSRPPAGSEPGLDALLHLPSGFVTTEPDAVSGAGEMEWRRRFTKAELELAEARQSLEDTKRELDAVAHSGSTSQWSIAPPTGGGGGGASPTTSPLSFKLRQQLRGDRERIEVREKALRGLRIEADLAGVPKTWRATRAE